MNRSSALIELISGRALPEGLRPAAKNHSGTAQGVRFHPEARQGTHRNILLHGGLSIEPNPFRTAAVRPGAIGFLSGDGQADPPLLINRLADSFLQHRSGQILGEHGSGKSTLVSSLVKRLRHDFDRTQRLCFVKPLLAHGLVAQRCDSLRHCRSVSQQLRQTLATCSAGTLLVIDGAEQLSVFAYHQWMRSITRKNIAVLITSHRKLRRMPVLFRTQISSAVIGELTRRQVRQSSERVRNIVEADLLSRDLDTISNVRDYWFELYDLVQPHLQPGVSYREQHCAQREVEHG